MSKFKLIVSMEYEAEVEIEAENEEDAMTEARDLIGDGKLYEEAELVDYSVENISPH